MNLFALFSLINGILATFFGLFVYLKNWKNSVNKKFFLMSIGVAIWSFSYVKWLSMPTEEGALFWTRMLNFFGTLIPIFYLHWILAFLNLDRQKRGIIIFGYVLTFIFLFFSFTPYYIESVKHVLSFPYWPQAGPLYICFIILGYIGLVGYGIFQLFKARKVSQKEKRNQIDYIILGSILGFGGGATNFPLMLGISLIPPFGQPLVSVYSFLFMIAILKYHLFDVRVILTELLVAVMGVLLLINVFISKGFSEYLRQGTIFLLFCIFAYYFIKATHEEEKRREKIEKLAIQERALRARAEKMVKQEVEMVRKEAEMKEEAEKMALRERQLKEEIEKIALEQKKLAEVQKEIAEERTKKYTQKEKEVIELKKKISQLEEKLKETLLRRD